MLVRGHSIKNLVGAFVLFALICGNKDVKGQKYEIGLAGGVSNYFGDLTHNVELHETHPAGGLFGRYHLNNYFHLRGQVLTGQISGTDANRFNTRSRNLSFRSRIWEVSTLLEFNFLPFGSGVYAKSFTSYFFTGIAAFHHNPQAYTGTTWIDLQPLGTEGQTGKDKYSKIQVSIPIGMGIKWSYGKNWIFGVEVGARKTFTDYMDDVSTRYPDPETQIETNGELAYQMSDRSGEIREDGQPIYDGGDQRGNPILDDWYIFGVFTISYRPTPIQCWKQQF